MQEVTRRQSLCQKLDEIDDKVEVAAIQGYYDSRLAIIMSQWEKGKVVAAAFRGVKTAPSYRQIERDTGRDQKAVKKWHTLYLKHPDKAEYLPLAEECAQLWTEKALQKEKKIALASPEAPPLPKGKYNVIYADPPWMYSDKCDTGGVQKGGGAHKHYPLMTITELCELDIDGLAADGAVLFLWVTSPLLAECFEVINAWGFKYKASFVWDKIKHNMGHYNSVRHEFLLICTKGSFMPENKKLYDSVVSVERSKHSEKPEKFREIIESLYPSGKKVELFARKQVKGWVSYGNDVALQG